MINSEKREIENQNEELWTGERKKEEQKKKTVTCKHTHTQTKKGGSGQKAVCKKYRENKGEKERKEGEEEAE